MIPVIAIPPRQNKIEYLAEELAKIAYELDIENPQPIVRSVYNTKNLDLLLEKGTDRDENSEVHFSWHRGKMDELGLGPQDVIYYAFPFFQRFLHRDLLANTGVLYMMYNPEMVSRFVFGNKEDEKVYRINEGKTFLEATIGLVYLSDGPFDEEIQKALDPNIAKIKKLFE